MYILRSITHKLNKVQSTGGIQQNWLHLQVLDVYLCILMG